MEDSEYASLKASFSNIPVKALSRSCRKILSKNLDTKQLLPSEFGYPRDFRGLAELIGIPHVESRKFEKYNDPTLKILETWEIQPNAMLGNLIDHLEKIQRLDVIQELIPALNEQTETFQHFQNDSATSVQVSGATSYSVQLQNDRHCLTCQDLKTGACTIYDAYVCYADDDSDFVQDLAKFLESKEIGLKLFIRGRDMLAGSSELDTNIELIKNRCRRMLIILTENFMYSSQCAFQISFATSLSIEQRERILVPVLVSPCDVPSVLFNVSKIDFTKSSVYEWMWERLIMSLIPQKKLSVPSEIKLPAQPYQSSSPEPVTSRKSPVITFPETARLSPLPVGQTSSRLTLFVNPMTRLSEVSENNPTKDELVEPESHLNDSAGAKVVVVDKSPIITVPDTIQVQPISESSAAFKSSNASTKSSYAPSSEKIPNQNGAL